MLKVSLSKIYLLILIVLYIYLNYFKAPLNSNEYTFWANLNFWLFSLPFYFFLNKKEKVETFPFIGLTGVFLFFSYSLPIFFVSARNYQTGYLNPLATKVAFFSYLVFFISYYIFNKTLWVKKTYTFEWLEINSDKIKTTAYLFLGIYILSLIISVSFIGHLGDLGIYIYIGLILLLIRGNYKVSMVEKGLFVLMVLGQFLIRFTGGLISTIALFSVYLFIIDSLGAKRKIRSALWLIPFFISYLIFSPLKHSYRAKVWYSGESYTLSEQLKLIYNLYTSNEDEIEPSLDSKEKENFAWRYSYQMSALSTVLEQTPLTVPYWNGESYNFFSKFIPRFLWPDKPEETMGYKFGVTYGIMNPDNYSTSMNTPILAEMYINFGYYGIFWGMILFAFVYFILNYFFNNSNANPFSSVISIAILFKLMIHESNFTLVFGNIPLMLITIYVILKLIKA